MLTCLEIMFKMVKQKFLQHFGVDLIEAVLFCPFFPLKASNLLSADRRNIFRNKEIYVIKLLSQKGHTLESLAGVLAKLFLSTSFHNILNV